MLLFVEIVRCKGIERDLLAFRREHFVDGFVDSTKLKYHCFEEEHTHPRGNKTTSLDHVLALTVHFRNIWVSEAPLLETSWFNCTRICSDSDNYIPAELSTHQPMDI